MELSKELRDKIAKAFRADVVPEISDAAIDAVLNAGELVKYGKKKPIVQEGEVNPDLYITMTGVTRVCYFDGSKEITFGFGEEGSLFLSPLSYVRNLPAYFSLIAVTECDMLRVPKARLAELVRNDHDVAFWFFNLSMSQWYNLEFKMKNTQENAKQRYLDLIKGRDVEIYKNHRIRHVDISKLVSDRVLASYLGVIPTHLSNIKNEIIQDERKKKKG